MFHCCALPFLRRYTNRLKLANQDSLTKVGAGFIFQNVSWTSNGATYDLFMNQMMLPWMKYFIAFDPKTALVNVNCPMLVLNGEKDTGVLRS